MPHIFVSIGSNVEPETNIRRAIQALRQYFGELDISAVYQNSAVGFEGDDFLNLVAGFDNHQSISMLVEIFHTIEAQQGRRRNEARFTPRTIDIDLLLYGDRIYQDQTISIPRDEITRYAFVLQPLAELAPNIIHPVEKRSIAELWSDYDRTDIYMQPVKLDI